MAVWAQGRGDDGAVAEDGGRAWLPGPGAHPCGGVYAGRAVTEAGIAYTAAINVGVNPQFGGDPATTPWRVEAYLLDFDGDLYDQRLRVELHERLRDELKFESVAALVEQMALDVDRTRDL